MQPQEELLVVSGGDRDQRHSRRLVNDFACVCKSPASARFANSSHKTVVKPYLEQSHSWTSTEAVFGTTTKRKPRSWRYLSILSYDTFLPVSRAESVTVEKPSCSAISFWLMPCSLRTSCRKAQRSSLEYALVHIVPPWQEALIH